MISVADMRFWISIVCALAVWIPASGAAGVDEALQTLSGQTMGTTYSVKYLPGAAMPAPTKVHADIEQILQDVNQAMSTYIADSEISRFNKADRSSAQKISRGFAEVVQHALDLAAKTDGAFEPTIAPLLRLYKFGAGAGNEPPKLPSSVILKGVMPLIDYRHIILTRPSDDTWLLAKKLKGVELDLSAVAKGYGVDQVFMYLQNQGAKALLVEIGGELRAAGRKPSGTSSEPWTVGIERPDGLSRSPMTKVILRDKAIATSGNYRNFKIIEGKRVGHVINPRLGEYVPNKIASVSVLAANTMAADGLATALLSMGDDQALSFVKKENIPALFIMLRDNHLAVEKSDAFVEYEKAAATP